MRIFSESPRRRQLNSSSPQPRRWRLYRTDAFPGDQGTRDLERGRPRPRDFPPARTALRWTQSKERGTWSADALVREILPPARTTLRWTQSKERGTWSADALVREILPPARTALRWTQSQADLR